MNCDWSWIDGDADDVAVVGLGLREDGLHRVGHVDRVGTGAAS